MSPAAFHPTSKDSFVQRLHITILSNLDDPALDVKKLLRMVGMSRTDLHRKLEKMTGMSTTEYVRQMRLQKAAELLLAEPEWSIYQVALEVGFASQSYFTRRFREVFGMCPVEFRLRRGALEHLCKGLEHS